jgi:type I restriction enzyme S subunit
MIADLKPYPEYKESGLPWLGRVPSHWQYRRTKFLFRERLTKGFPNEPLLAATQTKGVVKKTDYGERTVTAMKDFHLLKLVMPGDFVISLRSFEGGIEIAHCRGIISPAYTVLEPRTETRRNYYRHFFKSPDFIRNLTLFVTGIREGQNIDYERLSRAYMPLPPEAEQEQIGRFLDWANGRLERAIRAKRKVIELLHEQKQAIIHKAVIQGLDPNVPKRDSGIPWLGEIPAHWDVRRLKHSTTPIEQGWSPQCDAQPADSNEWGVLKVGCVNKDVFRPEQNKKLPGSLQPDPDLEIRDGDILVSRANTRELLGLAALAENPPAKRMLCDKLFRFRAKGELFNERFLVSVLRSKPCREQIESATNGASSSMQNIGQGVLKNLWTVSPTVVEQKQIVAYIAAATIPLTTAIDRYEREITLLREYRTRLVADVVTGKLDVREAALSLPEEEVVLAPEDALDEAEEPELEDVEN